MIQNDLSIKSVEHIPASVQEMDLSRAFQRLSSRYKINTQDSATQETKAKKISLRDVFERLANLSQAVEQNNLERAKVAAELRQHATQLKEAMDRVQTDSQKVFLAQSGLGEVLQFLESIRSKVHEAIETAVTGDETLTEELKMEASQLLDKLNQLPKSTRFNGQQLFGQGSEFAVAVGVDTSVAANLDLENVLTPLQDIDLDGAHTPQDFQHIEAQLSDSMEDVEGKLARLQAIHQRLGGYADTISTADNTLKAFGHQLRHVSEAQKLSHTVSMEIKQGTGLSFLR